MNALHDKAFELLVDMEGLTKLDLSTQYHELTGGEMDDEEGTLN